VRHESVTPLPSLCAMDLIGHRSTQRSDAGRNGKTPGTPGESAERVRWRTPYPDQGQPVRGPT
jgi:hypothetical protein